MVNINSQYKEQQIVKVWDAYIRNKGLRYLVSGNQQIDSLFLSQGNTMSLSREAGILIRQNGWPYINSKGESVSICGAVDNISLEQQLNYNGIIHDLSVALAQINEYRANLSQHNIIFPYHITPVHWVLGEIKLHFISGTLNTAVIHIYNPLQHGGSTVQEQVRNQIENLINQQLQSNISLVSNGEITNQQQDGSSCGVISAENGKGIIDGGIEGKKSIQYNAGAQNIRETHIQEVGDQRFNKMQERDEVWQNPRFEANEEDLIQIVAELDKTQLDRNEIFGKGSGSELGSFVREKLQEQGNTQGQPLWDLLFKNEGGEYQDGAVDTLWLAHGYLQRVYFGQEEVSNKRLPKTPSRKDMFVPRSQQHQGSELKVKDKQYATTPSTFKRLVADSDVFVDKSLFIKDIIDDSVETMLITRPRRWGKTLNMDMLKTFFEIEVDKQTGSVIKESFNLRNPGYFNGEESKEQLQIWKNSYIDARKIANLLIDNEGIASVKLNSRNTIDRFITNVEDTNYEEWGEEKDNILSKKRSGAPYTQNDMQVLEKIKHKHYVGITSYFSDLSQLVEQTKVQMQQAQQEIDQLKPEKEKLLKQKKQIEEQGQELSPQNKQQLDSVQKELQRLHEERNQAFEELRKEVERKIGGWRVNIDEQEQEKYSMIDSGFGLVGRNLGKYPVIFITFDSINKKGNKELTQEEISQGMKLSISRAYEQHLYLRNILDDKSRDGSSYNEREKASQDLEIFNRIYNQHGQNANEVDLKTSIQFLSQLLHEHFGKRVYVLIDEYDAPMNSSIGQGYYEDVVGIIRGIFRHGMKNNEHLEKAIMTGILRIAKADLFSGLNNFSEYGVLDSKYAEHFGFTEVEVEQLLQDNLEGDSQQEITLQKDQVKAWYNGYRIGNEVIYNPWSIMHCLDRAKASPRNALQEYWLESGSPQLIEEAFNNLKTTTEVENLLRDSYLHYQIDKFVNLQKIKTNKGAFFSLLLHTGYLTRAGENSYRVPNTEVKKYFYESLLPRWVENKFGIGLTDLNELADGFASNIEDQEQYKEMIQTKLLDRLNAQNIQDRTEADFQVLLGGVANLANIRAMQDARHVVYSEAQTKHRKKIDGFFVPTGWGDSNTVIIHEYKKSDKANEQKRNEVLEDASWQIYVNQYIESAISLRGQESSHHNWIITRAMLFFKDAKSKWSVNIKEFSHTVQQAREVNGLFSENGGLLENWKELLGLDTKAAKESARKRFLQEKSVDDLYSLLNRYVRSVEEQPLPEEEMLPIPTPQLLANLKGRQKRDAEKNKEKIRGILQESEGEEVRQKLEKIKGIGNKSATTIINNYVREKRKAEEEIKNPKDRQKKYNGILALEESSELEGMEQEEIENNLKQIALSNNADLQRSSLYIENCVIDKFDITEKLVNWKRWDKQKHYVAIIKLENTEEKRHAVLLHAIKTEKGSIEMRIIDSLSREDSEFIEEMQELVEELSLISNNVQQIYSGRQNAEHGTCGDVCLIMLQELCEAHLSQKEEQIETSVDLSVIDLDDRAIDDIFLIQNEYREKLQAQLIHYYQTGELFDTARQAIEEGYYVVESKQFQDVVNDYSTLHQAVATNNLQTMERMIANGADILQYNENNQTPLQVAVLTNNVVAARLLFESYVPMTNVEHEIFNIRLFPNGIVIDTVLHVAVEQGDEEMVRLLVEHGANPVRWNANADTALHLAADIENPSITGILLNGIQEEELMNLPDANGFTALDRAIGQGNIKTAIALIEYGGNTNVFTREAEEMLEAVHIQNVNDNPVEEYLILDNDIVTNDAPAQSWYSGWDSDFKMPELNLINVQSMAISLLSFSVQQ